MPCFTHLHVHSHFSILDGMSKVPDLIGKCKRNGMYAMALTDHGNMYGIKELVDCANKENGKLEDAIKAQKAVLANAEASPEEKQAAQEQIDKLSGQYFKPIIGIEAYVAHRSLHDKDAALKERDPETGRERIVDRSGYHLILLAKNKQGYKNLCKLSSIAFTEGFFYNPRIDRNVLEKWHEGIICCSACLGGELPQKIMKGDIEGAEEAVRWYRNLFGDDFYIELQRHQTDKPNAAYDTYERQKKVNVELVRLARKYGIKLVATNDVHFVEEEHGEAHDRLICLSTGKDFDDPNRLHYTKQEWLKSPDEMAAIFADLPEALANTAEVADKVEAYSINSDPIMPMFDIPASFGSEEEYRSRITPQDLFDEFTRNEKGEVVLSQENAEKKIEKLGGYDKLYRIKFEADYLRKLVMEGAHKRYGEELSEEQLERINFELHTIKTMGFPGYFLIVQDYIRAAREELDVSVGPGRGSAAGSVVAYCLWITDIDPLKYNLLFERFLNPDRISLPDIDVDFDDAGRGKVLDWITKKYGKERVAHIITYGTMATKSAIADVGRVQKLPLPKVNEIKGFIPDRGFPDNIKDAKGKSPKVNLANCFRYVPQLKEIMEGPDTEVKQVLHYAEELEDTNRQVGIHACGVIIGADDLTRYAPVCTIKDKDSGEDVLVTQYDGHVVEDVGLIKMDFLGLKNLTIIKDALRNIKKRHHKDLDIDHIPIDDKKTYKLFSEGNTVATFQFESPGMQKYLKELEPSQFEDLIAMNALYRPGPMAYIPDFIKRKHGQAPVEYDIPCMEQYLSETYGVTVYQEQVMLLSRQLAGFTRGQSDTLRKAMGKKQIEKMNELEQLFYKGGEQNGHPHDKLKKIWEDWKKFAEYAFNKSHATCYSWVAYQTAYLKAHYPAEYMAAVLTSSLSDISRLSELMEDCKRNKLEILPPSVNESDIDFAVNEKGQIRFGLGAIKGMGEVAAQAIIDEREKNGRYVDIFDFLDRVDLKTLNRKNMEALAKSGAFDQLEGTHRALFFHVEADGQTTFLEKLIRWEVQKRAENPAQMSLFGADESLKDEVHPNLPEVPEWSVIERCNFEREVVGVYLSGHPLNLYKREMQLFTNVSMAELNDLEKLYQQGKTTVRFGGMVTEGKTGVSQRDGKSFSIMRVEDFEGGWQFRFFNKEAVTFRNFCTPGEFIYGEGTIVKRKVKDDDGNLFELPAKLMVSHIMPMANLMQERVKCVSFNIMLSDIDERFCTELKKLTRKYKGSTPVKVEVVYSDPEQQLSLLMLSQNIRVQASEMMNVLDEMPGVYNVKAEV